MCGDKGMTFHLLGIEYANAPTHKGYLCTEVFCLYLRSGLLLPDSGAGGIRFPLCDAYLCDLFQTETETKGSVFFDQFFLSYFPPRIGCNPQCLSMCPPAQSHCIPTVLPPSRCYGALVHIANYDKMEIFLFILSKISSDFSGY